MPSAPEELRQEWGGEDGVGDDKAIAFLVSRGWRMSRTFMWTSPAPLDNVSEAEFRALLFLIQEWDFGYAGYAPAKLEQQRPKDEGRHDRRHGDEE